MRPLGSLAVRNTHSTKTHVPKSHVENKARGNYNNRGEDVEISEEEEEDEDKVVEILMAW